MPDSLPAPEEPWRPQRLSVPRDDDSILVVPSLDAAAIHAQQNHQLLESAPVDIHGKSLGVLRREARAELLAVATRYTGELLSADVAAKPEGPMIAGGHQPALFHPGVWVKNFAMHRLAARTNGVAVNLVVDNDILTNTRIRIPAGDRNRPRIDAIPLDDDLPNQPWEEARVRNRGLFASFGSRVVEAMAPWGVKPLIAEIWPDAVAQLSRSDSLRDCLTAARCRVEHRWGVSNLELPISLLCGCPSFLWFAAHVIARISEFRAIHNAVLAEYRQVNRVRSRTHPVPELAQRDGFEESPFWVWRAGDNRRKRVFARKEAGAIQLSDGTSVFASLPYSSERELTSTAAALGELAARGIRFRTRALSTTLFSRLCLCDLFIHGIGGSKYDEMTDRIICRFFGMPAPAFLTMTATVQIPPAEPFDVHPRDRARVRGQLRDLHYNPDRHLAPGIDPHTRALIAEKKQLVAQINASQTTGTSGRERHLRLKEVNRDLAELASDPRTRLEEELAEIERELYANTVLKNREFAFCLYPAEKLRALMNRL